MSRAQAIARSILLRTRQSAQLAVFAGRQSVARSERSQLALALVKAIAAPELFIGADGRKALARIEALGDELARDESPLEVVDYGAGRLGKLYSEAQMETGVEVQVQVREAYLRASSRGRKAARLMAVTHAAKPSTVIELGTNLGISGACVAFAQQMNGDGRLFTIEGSAALAQRAATNIDHLGLGDRVEVLTGRFDDVLPDLLDRCGPFELAFIDGHHDGDATVRYYQQLREQARPGAVLVFDDIWWSPNMTLAWRTVVRSPSVASAVTFGGMGFAILN